MKRVLSIVLAGGILFLFGAATVSSVWPPPNEPYELQDILGRLREDHARLNEAIRKLEEDEAQLQKYLASKDVDPKPDAK